MTSRITAILISVAICLSLIVIARTSPVHVQSSSANAAPALAAIQSLSLPIQQDTYIASVQTTKNFGSETYIYIGLGYTDLQQPEERRALLLFDSAELPAGATVHTATLTLYQIEAGGGTETCRISSEALKDTWNETTVTWDTAPQSSGLGDPPSEVDSMTEDKTWDVKNIVQSWANGDKNYGILLQGCTNEVHMFNTKESQRYIPRLDVLYSLDAMQTATAQALTATAAYTSTSTAYAELTATAAYSQTATAAISQTATAEMTQTATTYANQTATVAVTQTAHANQTTTAQAAPTVTAEVQTKTAIVKQTATAKAQTATALPTVQAQQTAAAKQQTANAQAQTAQANNQTATAQAGPTMTAQAQTATAQIIPIILTPVITLVPLTDLVADKLEVTQASQDLNNSVRLVKNKRTFVRFHAHSVFWTRTTYAILYAFRGGTMRILYPINQPSGNINIHPSPDRGVLNHSFLFELPSRFKEGNVTLIAVLNPSTSWRTRSPIETSYANNVASTVVSFETVPRLNLVLYRVGYASGGTTYYPPASHATQLVNWLKRAYPIDRISVWYRTTYRSGGRPSCGDVNSILTSKRIWDILFGWSSSVPSSAHYYGMVDDGGGFMRGCAMGIPHHIASGPTGTGTWGWDFDGSYGDWYGGHELAHTYGRYHAEFCGAGGGVAYPYANGRISPVLSGNTAIYGFNIGTKDIYGPNWKDVMTYCSNQWMSDFTYEGLMTYFQTHPILATTSARLEQDKQDRLMVVGTINQSTGEVVLQPFFVVPDAEDAVERDENGAYAIVLRDAAGAELARYPFTPYEMHEDGPTLQQEQGDSGVTYLLISELVPYVEGTASVDIEGPDQQVITTVKPGSASPTVTITSPNGGEVLSGDTITVEWTASDPDGDTLRFNVQYSPDNGATWEMIAQGIEDTSVELDAANVIQGDQALFRVWASDGLNTASDVTDAPFSVPNRAPVIKITSPEDNQTIAVSQTLTLEGEAYDIDSGTLEDEQVTWTSSLNGPLGTGTNLAIATLITGTHTIIFQADDGHGSVVSDTVTVQVLGEPTHIPTTTGALSVGPLNIPLQPATGVYTTLISVDNLNGSEPISWTAKVDVPWIVLDKTIGSTPDTILVTFTDSGLDAGTHPGTVTISNPSIASGEDVTVRLMATVADQPKIYLPMIMR